GSPALGLTAVRDLDLPGGHQQVGTLVRLVLLQLLTGRQVDGDNPRLAVAPEGLRMVWRDVQRSDVPALQVRLSRVGFAVDHVAPDSAEARSARRPIHSAPAVSVAPWAMIEMSTVSAAMWKTRVPALTGSAST